MKRLVKVCFSFFVHSVILIMRIIVKALNLERKYSEHPIPEDETTEIRILEREFRAEFPANKVGEERSCPNCGGSHRELLFISQDGFDYVLCKECGFVYVTPIITVEKRRYFLENFPECKKISEFWGKQYWIEENLQSDELRFSNYLRKIKKYKKGGRLLDVGCASGNFVRFAEKAGYECYGVDSSPVVQFAKDELQLNLKQGFFEEISFDEKFDIITMWETLEHVNNPKALLIKANELLFSEGIIGITVPNFNNLEILLLRERCPHCRGVSHVNMFTIETLSNMLRDTGFEILEIEAKGSSNWDNIINYLSMKLNLINSPLNVARRRSEEDNNFFNNRNAAYFSFPVELFLKRFSIFFKAIEYFTNKGGMIVAFAIKEGPGDCK